MPARRGVTLVEQVLVTTVLAILATIAIGSGARLLDAVAVESAAQSITDLLALAREHALASGLRTAVRFDADHARVVVHAGRDTLARGEFGTGGLQLEATRDSLAYAPTGLGVGAANLRITVHRGTRHDTITVSRLGRVQRR